MKCPYCGYYDTSTVDTRSVDDGYTMRRRACVSCRRTFRTNEIFVPDEIKNDIPISIVYCRKWTQRNIVEGKNRRKIPMIVGGKNYGKTNDGE